VHNLQTIEWTSLGVFSIVERSISEDSYGVTQYDILKIIKLVIKLKNVLDKDGSVKSVVHCTEFSRYLDDLLLDREDIRALHAFVSFKEL
jgi:hypothetical protein